MIFLDGLKNFLVFLSENWTTIVVTIGAAIALGFEIRDFCKKSKEEKITIAKEQIQQIMLKYITEAELDYAEWNKSGSIKRSQVINEIFEKYPILSKVTNQVEIIEWLDEVIDTALKTMRDVFKINTEETVDCDKNKDK